MEITWLGHSCFKLKDKQATLITDPFSPDIGYSLDEGDLLFFYSFNFVQSFNLATGGWSSHIPIGWIYIDWPFYYELDTGAMWFAWPPESGLWVYHFSTSQWDILPRIIP